MFGLQPLLEKATSLADHVLSKDVAIQFQVSWKPPDPTASKAIMVPVYLIAGKRIAIFVPGNERCVLVEEPALREFITRFFGEGSEDSDDAASFVAVMLLHEAGHVHYGDAGNYSAFEEDTNGGHKSLNVDKSKEKEIEFRADRFAADQLKQATSDKTNVDRFVAAIAVQMSILTFQNTLFGKRLIDDFGATTLSAPSSFWDVGVSHPNMELRMLTVLAQLNPTVFQGLLDDFLARRTKKSDGVIYQASPGNK